MTLIKNDDLIAGVFVVRNSRFSATVEIDGIIYTAYVPNSGRMKELLVAGANILLAYKDIPGRKTKYDLMMVEFNNRLINIDSRLPNEIINRALQMGNLPQFAQYPELKREARYSQSRLDFKLAGPQGICYIEVKSVTLVKEKVARFPDAPTPRGARHLRELAKAIGEGCRGAVIFVIQREDALAFTPNDVTDPGFGETLRTVAQLGVEVYAYTCSINVEEIRLLEQVEIVL